MRATHPLVQRLNTEWRELAPAPVPDPWRAEPALARASDLSGVLASVRSAPDAMLGALLRTGEAAAQRVVLQAMLGCAVLAAASDPGHDLDDYLGELWLTIATYPLARRPTRVAANLALDTRKRVRRRELTRPVDPASLPIVTVPASGADLLLARARRTAVIDADAARALHLVYVEGLSSCQAAAVLDITPAAFRQRCHRALRRLELHAADLLEVAA